MWMSWLKERFVILEKKALDLDPRLNTYLTLAAYSKLVQYVEVILKHFSQCRLHYFILSLEMAIVCPFATNDLRQAWERNGKGHKLQHIHFTIHLVAELTKSYVIAM